MPKAPRWHHPTAIEQEYTAALKRYAGRCGKAVSEYVIPEIDAIVEEANRYRPDALGSQSEGEGWVARLNRVLKRVLSILLGSETGASDPLSALSGASRAVNSPEEIRPLEYAERVSAFNKRQFQRMMRKAYGIDVTKREPWLRSELKAWESQNLALIRSIPEQYVDKLQGRIIAAVQQGRTSKEVQALIRETYDLPKNRAALIADDQIGKINGQLTRLRQQAVGIGEYRWRGVLDSRERRSHVHREGEKFSWSKPPSDGHPGEPILCRCSAEAVLPELEDLDLS